MFDKKFIFFFIGAPNRTSCFSKHETSSFLWDRIRILKPNWFRIRIQNTGVNSLPSSQELYVPQNEGLGEFQFWLLEKKLSTLPTLLMYRLWISRSLFDVKNQLCVVSWELFLGDGMTTSVTSRYPGTTVMRSGSYSKTHKCELWSFLYMISNTETEENIFTLCRAQYSK